MNLIPAIRKSPLLPAIMAVYWLAAVSGCSSINARAPYLSLTPEESLRETYFDVEIPTPDGEVLAATLYQPALAPGEQAPLIIHTHGFGAFRASGPYGLYAQFVLSGRAAVEAWRQGYWVLSYDQRGFGESGGDVLLMHPDYEVRDLSHVIDWAEAQVPRLARKEGDPLIATIGESYGGAVQILASMQDARIDALVPIATWYDLADALAPLGQVKSAWTTALVGIGTLSSGFDFGLALDYLDLLGGTLSEPAAKEFALRSPSRYCNQGQAIQADALFLQGFRDSLMPLRAGYRNWQCALGHGRDARLIAIQDGHILPWPMQRWSGLPLYNTQDDLVCGDTRFTAVEMIQQWLDEKLREHPPQQRIPPLCVTFADDEGVVLTELAEGGPAFEIRPTRLKLSQSGSLEVLLSPLDQLLGWIGAGSPQPAEAQATSGGWLRPAFIPLVNLSQPQDMIGFPQLTLNLETDDGRGLVFVALGVRGAHSRYVDILSEQFVPIAGAGTHRVEMPAVARQLKAGDTLVLVAQGFAAQYFLSPQGWLGIARISGSVELPLLESFDQNPSAD